MKRDLPQEACSRTESDTSSVEGEPWQPLLKRPTILHPEGAQGDGVDSSRTVGINSLPHEILVQILRHSTTSELLCSARLVSREWFEICTDRYVWKGRSFVCSKYITRPDLISFLKYASALEDLRFHEPRQHDLGKLRSEDIALALREAQNLKSLALRTSQVDQAVLQSIGECLMDLEDLLIQDVLFVSLIKTEAFRPLVTLRNLKKLTLVFCKIDDYTLCKIVENCSANLGILELNYCPYLGDAFFKTLGKAGSKVKRLHVNVSQHQGCYRSRE